MTFISKNELKENLQQREQQTYVKRLIFSISTTFPNSVWAKMNEDQISEQEKSFESRLRELTIEQIKFGIRRCRDEDNRPPNSLNRIIFLSKGLIDIEKAYQMALSKDFSNIIIKLAVKKSNFNGIWSDEYKREKAFKYVYDILCNKAMAGEEVIENTDLTALEDNREEITENLNERTANLFSSRNSVLNAVYDKNRNYYYKMMRVYGDAFVKKFKKTKAEIEKADPKSNEELTRICADMAKRFDKFMIAECLLKS